VSAARRTLRAAKARTAEAGTAKPRSAAGVGAATKTRAKVPKPSSKTAPPVFLSTGFWLMKSEPDVYSIDDLQRDRRTGWEGVRNYQARNFMRDSMRVGDRVLFYHSNADPSGVAGIAKVCAPAIPDPTAFDSKSEYFDPKSDRDEPTWLMAQIEFVERFPKVLPLEAMREDPRFAGMALLARGQRLSVQPVSKAHFDLAARLGRGK
jgi:predicted RNA-binding protein with PUA-like domain